MQILKPAVKIKKFFFRLIYFILKFVNYFMSFKLVRPYYITKTSYRKEMFDLC